MLIAIYIGVFVMLKYIDSKFSNSSLKVKFELYLLPLFLAYIFIYFFPIENKKIKLISIPQIENVKFKGSYLDLIKSLENYAKENKLKVLNIKHTKEQIYFKVEINMKDINKLIHEIENLNKFSNLSNVSFLRDKNSFIFDAIIDFKKYYIKNEKEKIVHKIAKTRKYKLKAIIDKYVLINNKWLKTGSEIDGYKIKLLNKNTILLDSKSKKINLKIYKNEKYTQLQY